MGLIVTLIFISSGLFLGWSMGANDASNAFGTAVATRMIRFSTAAFLCSVFLIIGAVTSGAGAADGLGQLGTINALPGAFTAALAAAATVGWMSKLGLPASTGQAVVGSIIGWNLFSGSVTDLNTLSRILSTWIVSPILGAIFAMILHSFLVWFIRLTKPHLLVQDRNTRVGLILAGVFGSYAMGANGIGNVMGFFVGASPFRDLTVGRFNISSIEQLFLIGAIAVAVGVYTYSRRVMMTVGDSLLTLTPLGAFVVVVSHSLVLFIFSSTALEGFLASHGLPTIPLLPVSGSQAVIGSVVGIGLLQGIRGIRQIKWKVLVGIASGWITTPLLAAVMGFMLLFVVQNVFGQQVYQAATFQLTPPALERLSQAGLPMEPLAELADQSIAKATTFRKAVRQRVSLAPAQESLLLSTAELYSIQVDPNCFKKLGSAGLNPNQLLALRNLTGQTFRHKWEFDRALASQGVAWRPAGDIGLRSASNRALQDQIAFVEKMLRFSDAPT